MSRLQFGVALLLLCYIQVGQSKKFGIDELPTYPFCGYWVLGTPYASGGEPTVLTDFTFTTILEYSDGNGTKIRACGSSYIAKRWLLTAAHCAHEHFLGKEYKLTGARVREWNLTNEDVCKSPSSTKKACIHPAIPVTIDRILMHPEFDTSNYTNDIALLRLKDPVDWQNLAYLAPVCLPLTPNDIPNVDNLEGQKVTVTGWGRTEVIADLSPIKQKAELRVISLEECRRAYEKHDFLVGNTQLCTTSSIKQRFSDACEGDSGGPLTMEKPIDHDLIHYQVGVVSYGKKTCGVYNFPAIFTRVSSYMDWINRTISENKD